MIYINIEATVPVLLYKDHYHVVKCMLYTIYRSENYNMYASILELKIYIKQVFGKFTNNLENTYLFHNEAWLFSGV